MPRTGNILVFLTIITISVFFASCGSDRKLADKPIFAELNRGLIAGGPSPLLYYNLAPTENHLLILAHDYQNTIRAINDEYYVRPGLYADYAIALAKLDYKEEAARWFNKEVERFPASRTYVEAIRNALIPEYSAIKEIADTVRIVLPIPIDEAALAAELELETRPRTREEIAKERAAEREQMTKQKELTRKEKEQARKEAEKEKKAAAKEKEKNKRIAAKEKEEARKEAAKEKEELRKQVAKEKEEARKQAAKEKEEARKEALQAKEEAYREMQERRKEEQRALEQERRDNERLGKEREREEKEAKAEELRKQRGESKKNRK